MVETELEASGFAVAVSCAPGYGPACGYGADDSYSCDVPAAVPCTTHGTAYTLEHCDLVLSCGSYIDIAEMSSNPFDIAGLAATANYTIVEETELNVEAGFAVVATCAPEHVGVAVAAPCRATGVGYELSGCDVPLVCRSRKPSLPAGMCASPITAGQIDDPAYVVTETELSVAAGFLVTAVCAPGVAAHPWTSPEAAPCTEQGSPYTLTGCTLCPTGIGSVETENSTVLQTRSLTLQATGLMPAVCNSSEWTSGGAHCRRCRLASNRVVILTPPGSAIAAGSPYVAVEWELVQGSWLHGVQTATSAIVGTTVLSTLFIPPYSLEADLVSVFNVVRTQQRTR